MFVKICGLTRREDSELASTLGATHLGCVLARDSPRQVAPREARGILGALTRPAVPVLVFRNQSAPDILSMVEEVGLTRTIQPHGISEKEVRHLESKGLTVHRVLEGPDVRLENLSPRPDRVFHFDGGRGGEGLRLDWTLFAPRAPRFCWIAGGIDRENLDELLRRRPWGIDLASGVESSPGVKDEALLREFFDAIDLAAGKSLARSGDRRAILEGRRNTNAEAGRR